MHDFFRGTRLFAFDLDGTLYLGDEAVAGAVDLVARVRRSHRVAFFTNNSAKSAREVREKLQRLGFEARPEEVHTSSAAAARYLREAGVDDLFVVGAEGLRQEIESAGLRPAGAGRAKNLVVGLDPEFSYGRLAEALSVLLAGGRFIACNEDARYPVGGGAYLPGCGAMVGAIAAASGRRPDFVAGKPTTYLLAIIARGCEVEPGQIVVVGDSWESDIAMALSYGSRAVLLGASRGDAGGEVLVVQDIGALRAAIGEA
jgi:HAD superfamily hydrolase (TIGR01450 family)